MIVEVVGVVAVVVAVAWLGVVVGVGDEVPMKLLKWERLRKELEGIVVVEEKTLGVDQNLGKKRKKSWAVVVEERRREDWGGRVVVSLVG